MGTDLSSQQKDVHQKATVKYLSLATWLEDRIKDRRMQPGSKLPSIRQLAIQHQLAKNTVISALHHLEARSLVEAVPKVGYLVKSQYQPKSPAPLVFDTIAPSAVSLPALFQDIMVRGAAFDIKPSEPCESLPGVLNSLHKNINKSARTQVLKKTLYYDDPTGDNDLKTQISQHYQSRGLFVSNDDICITHGCQHALFLALMATCEKGDNVIIESPGFYGVIQLLDQLGLHAIEVPVSGQTGVDIDAVKTVMAQYKVKACVFSPSFSTPTGALLSDEHKQQLAQLASQHGIAIIEDDIYGDLSFGDKKTPLKAWDESGQMILCSSFSKSLSRDLRMGWIMGGRWHQKIQQLKLVSSLSNSQAVQQGLQLFLQDGSYQRFLRQRNSELRKNRDQLVQTLQGIWQDDILFYSPNGGLSVWAMLPQCHDTMALYNVALKHNIVITPGAMFTVERDYAKYLRLSFCHPLTEGRQKALQTLHQLSLGC